MDSHSKNPATAQGRPLAERNPAALHGSPVTRSNLAPLLKVARSNGMFGSLSEPDTDIVLSFCHFSFVGSDVKLFSAGDQADYLLFVADGRVNVTCRTADNKVMHVGMASIGAVLGESSITSISPRAATVTTASRCALGYLYYKDFNRLCAEHPETALRFLVMLFNQMNARMHAMVSRLTNANQVRTAAELSIDLLSKVLFDRRVSAVDGVSPTERRAK